MFVIFSVYFFDIFFVRFSNYTKQRRCLQAEVVKTQPTGYSEPI